MSNDQSSISVVMLGATGAVGGEALKTLLKMPEVNRISLLGRRPVPDIAATHVHQHKIDIFKPASYADHITGHQVAICTLGVGEPSKVNREDFSKIDKQAVIDFAKACKNAGVTHFELLSSVGISVDSRSFYLRTKAELVEELKVLNFDRLSIFQPSMILTPKNRYGFLQGLTLVLWPIISSLFLGGM